MRDACLFTAAANACSIASRRARDDGKAALALARRIGASGPETTAAAEQIAFGLLAQQRGLELARDVMVAAALDPERFEAFMRGQPVTAARSPIAGTAETRATAPGAEGWREHIKIAAAG